MRFLRRKKEAFSSDKWVVFDFDGTIAETGSKLIDFFNEFIAPHFNVPKLAYSDLEPLRNCNIMQKMEYIKVPFYQLPAVIRQSRKNFRRSLTDLDVVDGLTDEFEKMRAKGYRLAIISSNRKKNIVACLNRHGVHTFEDIMCDKGKSLFVKHKTIRKFLHTKNIPASQMVYIGDEGRDVKACKRVRVSVLAVSWGWDSHDRLLNDASEQEIVDEPSQLFDRVASILG